MVIPSQKKRAAHWFSNQWEVFPCLITISQLQLSLPDIIMTFNPATTVWCGLAAKRYTQGAETQTAVS